MPKKDPSKFQGHVELARVLLEHGADVNAQDNERHTILYSIGHRNGNGTNGEEDAWFLKLKHDAAPSNLSFKSVDDLFEDVVHLLMVGRHLSRGTFPFLKAYASPAVALSLRLLPRLAKLVAYILIILNVRSLPFAWHIHLYWPVVKIRCRAWCARIRTLSLSSAVREAAARKFLDDLCPVGQNPLDFTVVTKAWAGIDDCDYNLHLSNSSYPKILDSVRMKSALMLFPYYVRTGGWIALAGTHFHFIREIPILARYEVRSQIAGWDHKWLYIVHRFVTHRKPTSTRLQVSKNDQQSPSASSTSTSNANATNNAPPNPNLLSPNSTLNLNPNSASASASPIPVIHMPSTPLTNLSPSPSSTNLQAMVSRSGASSTATGASASRAAVIAAAAIAPESDGATLHCVSVNVVVFKHGRITVPPALALAGEGLGATPKQGMEARTRALGHGLNGMRELYLGGWRAVPEGDERWWDGAMKGLEGRIEKRVGKVRGVREGLEGALQVRML